MDLQEDSGGLQSLPVTTSRNMSSSSSVFFSANQSPFFSPRSSTCQFSESTRSDAQCDSINQTADPPSSSSGIRGLECLENARFNLSDVSLKPTACISSDFQKFDHVVSNDNLPSYGHVCDNGYYDLIAKHRKHMRSHDMSFSPVPISLSSNRHKSYDIYLGLHGRKPSLLRFANWLRAELEAQGMSCFISDRARFRSSRKHVLIEKAMDVSSLGVVILTRKSFKNPYTIEELRFFSSKKILVPIYFDLSSGDCLVRDIVEKRGELWEKHGGELWFLYGGLEKEWKEAVNGLFRVDEWKLEAADGNWRDCILRAVTLLAMRLGRRSVVEQVMKWREKVDKEEFPGESERDYFELKARSKRKNLTVGWSKGSSVEVRLGERQWESGSRKGKEPVIWKESEKEIEMQSTDRKHYQKPKGGGWNSRRKKSTKIVYGKGIACVTGESGIGKTELLLEFAYRYHQRYKMVLWIGGESRYIRQNYLNLRSLLEVDIRVKNCMDKSKMKSFEEQEEVAISRVRKELMRNIPFLVVIDNLESEKDWWDHKLIMDLLPRFGGETHILISTRLPHVMNLEPLKLSYFVCSRGNVFNAGAILSEIPINPIKLLDTINRMPLRDISWSGREAHSLRKNTFLLQLFEVCFWIFDNADRPRSLATRMVLVSGWFAPASIPVSLLALAARKVPEKRKRTCFWRKLLHSLSCGFSSSYSKRSEAEASSMLLRFNIARSSTKEGYITFNELIKVYARERGATSFAHAMVQAVVSRGSLSLHLEHMWAACFLLFGFANDPIVVELKVSELLYLVKEVILPLAIRTFITFSRCSAALELLQLCTNALEVADQAFVTPVKKWLDKSLCWRPIQTNAQLNPSLWQELALSRATVLETRAKLMLRGGQFDIGDDLIRKAIFIRTSICGEDHPDTVSARETLSKLTRLLANVQTQT
ncbi:puromycin-sensitive aminopeptidase-like isoform X1 [Hibiscus syriacus]|uniref:Puromycin-sensitive aminopeptidase-like isoform X1 n=1 Tax=Hibiscus syriacus TaxID=106335 RepID=A0A6A2X6D0_HIBSY|nr:puromycin-sensitive aminopeptidase-like isoform X1 [Hibiscus syriacus]